MDVTSAAINPVAPDVQPSSPRDAQLETAVREASQSEPQQNNTQSDSNSRGSGSSARDETSNVGRNVDEHA